MTTTPPADRMQRRCPQCNSPIPPEGKFCESCGAKIEPQQICRNCKAPIPEGTKFCEVCGTPTSPAAPEQKSEPPVKVSSPVAPEPDKPVAPKIVEKPPVPEAPAQKPTPPQTTAQETPRSKNTLIIAGVAGIAILAIVIIFVVLPMLSGPTTGNAGNPLAFIPSTGTSTSTTTSPLTTSGSSATGSSLVPGPVETLPENLMLAFSVDKDAISGKITVIVSGPARNVVDDIEVTVTSPDGQVQTGHIRPSQKVDEITVPGSKQTDRVEVTVRFYSGKQYKVIDQLEEYKKRM